MVECWKTTILSKCKQNLANLDHSDIAIVSGGGGGSGGLQRKWWEAKICLCSMLKGQSGSLCTQSLPWTWTHAPGVNQICQSKYRELVSQCAKRWYKCQQGPTPKPDLLQRRNSSNLVVKIVLGSNCQHKCWMWWWCDKRLTWTWTRRLKVMACISLKLRKPYKSWLCVIPWYILPFSDLFRGEISYFWKKCFKNLICRKSLFAFISFSGLPFPRPLLPTASSYLHLSRSHHQPPCDAIVSK